MRPNGLQRGTAPEFYLAPVQRPDCFHRCQNGTTATTRNLCLKQTVHGCDWHVPFPRGRRGLRVGSRLLQRAAQPLLRHSFETSVPFAAKNIPVVGQCRRQMYHTASPPQVCPSSQVVCHTVPQSRLLQISHSSAHGQHCYRYFRTLESVSLKSAGVNSLVAEACLLP